MPSFIRLFVRDLFTTDSSSSEAYASELLENIYEMLPRYYMYSGFSNGFKSSTTQ